MVVVVGISFNLIIVRVDQGLAVGDTTVADSDAAAAAGPREGISLHFRASTTRSTVGGATSADESAAGDGAKAEDEDASLGGTRKGRWEV